MESPLKGKHANLLSFRQLTLAFLERTSRIYRIGPLDELVTLGHGSDITNPGSTTLINNPFINAHNVERTKWNGMEMFTGVKIYYEQRPMVSHFLLHNYDLVIF